MSASYQTTRDRVRELLGQGLGTRAISRVLGVAPSTVSYHRRLLGHPGGARFARRYDWEEVQRYHDAGNSAAACIERYGFARQTWYAAVKQGVISTDAPVRPATPFNVRRRPPSRSQLKARLIADGLREHRCEECGLTEWRGRPLSLALHHRNGDGLDNRVDNLQILCPNCHAQTPNFGALNRAVSRSSRARGPRSAP